MKKQLTNKDLNAIPYTLPTGDSESYADTALELLKGLEQLNPRLLPYFLAANTVLTLSGVRALDTYITFEDLSEDEIYAATTFLASNGIALFPHVSEYDDTEKDMYSLIHHAALAKIPEQYALDAWFPPYAPFTFDRLVGWTYLVEFALSSAMDKGMLPKEWLADRMSEHNVRFGILLGYPGEAIAGACWRDAIQNQDDIELPVISSEIAYHDAYNAAWPTYHLLEEQKDNPNIIGHQKLWSGILTAVYESEWHQAFKKSS